MFKGNILLLLCEEAFFLSKSGRLSIFSEENVLSMTAAWKLFSKVYSNFSSKYKVYEYFKQRGFFIRTGAGYGVDYVLYRDLPSKCHSELCVIISRDTHSSISSNNMSWLHVSSLLRILPEVMKLLLVCYVLPSPSASAKCPSFMEMNATSRFSKQLETDIHDSQVNLKEGWRGLDALCVHVMAATNRRLSVSCQKYAKDYLVANIQRNYSDLAIKASHKNIVGKKKRIKCDEKEVPSTETEESQLLQQNAPQDKIEYFQKKKSKYSEKWTMLGANR